VKSNDIDELPASSVELSLNGDDIDNLLKDSDYEIVHILKFLCFRDYNSRPVFYLSSNFGSKIFVQIHLNSIDSEMMSNLNIFMRIINALIPNLPISYER
jgi:hypothetical protein